MENLNFYAEECLSVMKSTKNISDYSSLAYSSDLNDFTKNDYYRKSLKDCAEGNDEWTFGYHALKSQFGGNFDRMYDFILAEMKKNTQITLIQSELSSENVAIYFTIGDYVFDTTATGDYDGK